MGSLGVSETIGGSVDCVSLSPVLVRDERKAKDDGTDKTSKKTTKKKADGNISGAPPRETKNIRLVSFRLRKSQTPSFKAQS